MDLFGVFEQGAQQTQFEEADVEIIEPIEEFKIIKQREDEGCVHEWYAPEDHVKLENPKRMAKNYKFNLDPFQVQAVKCLEQYESVLVAAHTSAGKTAVAEYAIAMAKRDKARVVYTSPIKALSNQKYRELQSEFGDVGLITGDVTLNQNAFCLVMTTEILRSMLYRGSEIVREVAWVIMDEVHYMRDRERGVVWEETIILLSQKVRFVFLSATIPNAGEFAEWICRVKRQPCHVVYTDYRPTPLEHFLCPAGADGLYLVVDKQGTFKEDKFKEAISKLEDGGDKRKKKSTEGSDLFKLVQLIKAKDYAPAIIFSFSKKEVEGFATAIAKQDLNSVQEAQRIEEIYKNAMNCLSEEDRQLPQITHMLPLLKKGIGIHHGGLLPIVKEIIEILFQEGLIKALFSTETFSMGVNMPSRTVVFTSVRKFDGQVFRWIQGGEYVQMSGRAGRRGIDDRGICILIFDEKMDQDVAKGMLKGNQDPLNSSFHLSYNMLLNALRIEDTDPEYIIRRSFHQFQNERQLPEMKQKYQELKERTDKIQLENEDQVQHYVDLTQQIENVNYEMREILNNPMISLPFLAIGRIVRIKSREMDWGWGIFLNFMKRKLPKNESCVMLDVIFHVKQRRKQLNDPLVPISWLEQGEIEVVPVNMDHLFDISTIKVNLPRDLKNPEEKQKVKLTFQKIIKQFGEDGIPLMHPIKDMKINDQQIDALLEKKEKLQQAYQNADFKITNQQILKFNEKEKLLTSQKILRKQIELSSKMVLSDDLKRMKRVLKRMQYLSKEDIVELKGKVACEIQACDEIMLTELLFSGLFQELSAEEICAVLTCLVHDENANDKFVIKNDKLNQLYGKITDMGKKIFQVYQDSKINIEEKEYLASYKPQMMEIALAWCQGQTFGQICKSTDQFEGSIIRCFRRLDELLKQLQEAAKVMGNRDLETQFNESSKKLKRGIVFAASLYL